MSPHYLDSLWCQAELKTFSDQLSGPSDKRERKIFVARALDTGERAWPDAVCNASGSKMPGWKFYADGDDVPWGFMDDWKGFIPPEMREEFFDLGRTVISSLRDLNEAMTMRAHQATRQSALHDGQAKCIYLYGRPDDAKAWRAARREIQKLGINIWPDAPEPLDIDEDRERRLDHRRAVSRCDAMLMVATDAGNLDDDLEVVGRNRRQLIASPYRKYLPCAVLVTDGALETPARRERAARFGIEWLDIGASDWPDSFRRWLQASAEEVRRREGRPPIGPDEEPS